MQELEELIDRWKELQLSGNTDEAQQLYEDKIFEQVIDRLVERESGRIPEVEVLFSVLGYTPEPIILTHRVLKPRRHIIFATPGGFEQAKASYEKYIGTEPVVITLKDASFKEIYDAMQAQVDINPAERYALDITGGKKSMVASAAIFGRDYGFDILYVDFEDYRKEFRRPIPGTEYLNLVYTPERDLPEIFHNLK